MIRATSLPALAAALLALAPAPARAQDADVPAAVRREGTYAFLYHVTFRPGKSDDGIQVLRDDLIPAWRDAGVEVTLYESLVGTRDVYLVLPLRDGPATLGWEVSPQDAETWTALVRRAGGGEAANRVVDRFIGFVERQSQDLVLLPTAEEEDR